MKQFKVLHAALIAAALVGCSYVTAVPTSPYAPVDGIPMPTVKPLLVISGGQASILFVPNNNRAYALRFGSFLAKHDFSAELTNGTLVKLTSNQDNTAVPIALINLVQEAVKAGTPIGAAFSGRADSAAGGLVQVYDIVFDEHGDTVQLRPLIFPNQQVRMPAGVMGPTFPVGPAQPAPPVNAPPPVNVR